MRQILVEHARRHMAEKRGGNRVAVTLSAALLTGPRLFVKVVATEVRAAGLLDQVPHRNARQAFPPLVEEEGGVGLLACQVGSAGAEVVASFMRSV